MAFSEQDRGQGKVNDKEQESGNRQERGEAGCDPGNYRVDQIGQRQPEAAPDQRKGRADPAVKIAG